MQKSKKLISLFLCIILCISLFASLYSCGDDNDDDDIKDDSSIEESTPSVIDNPTDAVISIDGVKVSVDGLNCDMGNKNAVIYDRNYKVDGKYSLYAPNNEEATDKTAFIVKYNVTNSNEIYTVLEYYEQGREKSNVYIPVNGFVLYIKTAPEGVTFSKKNDFRINNYENKPNYEKTDFATVNPESGSISRRISMYYPANGVLKDDKIYFIKPEDSFTLKENQYFISLKSTAGTTYTIIGFSDVGEEVSGLTGLLFTGEYNTLYAKEFYKEGKLFMSQVSKLNNISDCPAVTILGTTYYFDDEHINPKSGSDGVYLYTPEHSSLVTSNLGSFIDVVIMQDTEEIVLVGNDSEQTIIPTSNGYVVSFAGSCKSTAKKFDAGDKATSLLLEKFSNPDKFVRIAGKTYSFENMNVPLSESVNVVLFTSSYGEKTAITGIQKYNFIVIEDNQVTKSVSDKVCDIPENGYVLGVSSQITKLYSYSKKVSVGDTALISLAGNNYGFYTFEYTTKNETRYADYVVIYDVGSSTKTNNYGFEFSVDENGVIGEGSSAGDMTIPKGGFIVSGHGAGEIKVKEAFIPGATCIVDETKKTVSVLKLPEQVIYAASLALDERKKAFDNLKQAYASVDYKYLETAIENLSASLELAESLIKEGKADQAILLCSDIESTSNRLEYFMYESSPVENRSVWYRCNEKSDEDVLETVKLLSEMNVNAVYLETWYNGQFIGYASNPLITHHSANGNYDALEGFCRIAHQYGIEIHVWVENFFIGTTSTALSKATKEYHLIDKYGNDGAPTMYGYFCFLDPYTEYCRDLVMSVYKDILTKYDIDGFHLDYIRFPETNSESNSDFGYNEDIIKGFREAYNTTIDPKKIKSGTKDWKNWCKFREDIINNWVKEVYTTVKSLRPEVIVSAAVSNDYPGSTTYLFQNFYDWVQKGYMDEVFSMSYCADLKIPANNIKTFTNYTSLSCYYSIGLSAFESSPAEILVAQIQVARDNGAFGSNLFSWGSLIIHEENYFEAIKSSIWSEKSVQTYKLNETVAAYLERLISDVPSVYAYITPNLESFYNDIVSKAKSILQKANSVKFETDSDKLTYVTEALSDLDSLRAIMNNCTNKNVSKAMLNDIDFIIKCLKISENRLK